MTLCHILPERRGWVNRITKSIQVRRTRHAEHSWRSKNEHISDVLLWAPSHGWAKAERPNRTYIQQLCADTGCDLEDLPGAMDDREWWQKMVREIRAGSMTWWWWWWLLERELPFTRRPFSPPKYQHHCCSFTKIALALNNTRRLICH